jgi:hypothetical protein
MLSKITNENVRKVLKNCWYSKDAHSDGFIYNFEYSNLRVFGASVDKTLMPRIRVALFESLLEVSSKLLQAKVELSPATAQSLLGSRSSTQFIASLKSRKSINKKMFLLLLLPVAKRRLEFALDSDEVKTFTVDYLVNNGHVALKDLPKSTQMNTMAVPKAKNVKGTDHTNIKPDLLKAIKMFNSSKVLSLAAQLDDTEDVKASLKAMKLSTSGYLYSYFHTFFAVCLMKDKAKATTFVLSSPGMLKQFNAFTAGFASITSGSFLIFTSIK